MNGKTSVAWVCFIAFLSCEAAVANPALSLPTPSFQSQGMDMIDAAVSLIETMASLTDSSPSSYFINLMLDNKDNFPVVDKSCVAAGAASFQIDCSATGLRLSRHFNDAYCASVAPNVTEYSVAAATFAFQNINWTAACTPFTDPISTIRNVTGTSFSKATVAFHTQNATNATNATATCTSQTLKMTLQLGVAVQTTFYCNQSTMYDASGRISFPSGSCSSIDSGNSVLVACYDDHPTEAAPTETTEESPNWLMYIAIAVVVLLLLLGIFKLFSGKENAGDDGEDGEGEVEGDGDSTDPKPESNETNESNDGKEDSVDADAAKPKALEEEDDEPVVAHRPSHSSFAKKASKSRAVPAPRHHKRSHH